MVDFDFTNVSLFHFSDIYTVPLVLAVLLFFFRRIFLSEENGAIRKIIVFSFLMKVVFTFLFALIYEFYYQKVGDTFLYYNSTRKLLEFLQEKQTVSIFDVYVNPEFVEQLTNYQFERFGASTTTNIFALTLPLMYVTGGSYLGTTLVLSFFAFYGSLKLFQVLANRLPAYRKEAAIACLLLPSVSFWSAGLMKDTYSFAALCLTIYCCYNVLAEKSYRFRYVAGTVLFTLLMYATKPYMLLIWPCILLGILIKTMRKIPLVPLRRLAFFFLILAYAGGLYFLSQSMIESQSSELKRFSVDGFVNSVEAFNQMYAADQGQTSYTDVIIEDFTFWGIVKGIPNGLLVVFFRPFFWEVRNALMVFSSLESTAILLMTFLAFRWRKSKEFYKRFFQKDFVLGLLIFSLALALVTAFTTPNFGSLSRYKIPCMPVVFFLLLVFSKKGVEASVRKPAAQRNKPVPA